MARSKYLLCTPRLCFFADLNCTGASTLTTTHSTSTSRRLISRPKLQLHARRQTLPPNGGEWAPGPAVLPHNGNLPRSQGLQPEMTTPCPTRLRNQSRRRARPDHQAPHEADEEAARCGQTPEQAVLRGRQLHGRQLRGRQLRGRQLRGRQLRRMMTTTTAMTRTRLNHCLPLQ